MITLNELPFNKEDLSPYISKETIEYHYWKHHKAYVDKLNSLIIWTEYEKLSLEEIIKLSDWSIFNNSAQIWNHNFYWLCLTWVNDSKPSDELLNLINLNFWSFDNFQNTFSDSALNNFWSWWTWLIKDFSWNLKILNTSNAGTPIRTWETPILVIDVWEHAYYIDKRNDRKSYISDFWSIVNWDFVNNQIKKEA